MRASSNVGTERSDRGNNELPNHHHEYGLPYSLRHVNKDASQTLTMPRVRNVAALAQPMYKTLIPKLYAPYDSQPHSRTLGGKGRMS